MVAASSALHPGGIVLADTQQPVLINLEYFYLRVPSCTALAASDDSPDAVADRLGYALHLDREGILGKKIRWSICAQGDSRRGGCVNTSDWQFA